MADGDIKYTPETIQMLKEMDLYFEGDEIEKFYYVEKPEKISPEASDYFGSLATPIIQVFSVSIETNIDNDGPYEIYGSIKGIEGQDTRFYLYDRGCEDPETILKHGTLSLTGPGNGMKDPWNGITENGLYFPFMGINLDICLKDRIRDVEVIKGCFNLDTIIEEEEDYFDKLFKVVIRGEYGVACVYYAIFQFGALGTIEVAITELKDNQSDRFVDIYGSLVAGYGNGSRYCNNDDELENLKSTLLRTPSHQPMRVMIGNPIALSRYVVVVPAYSSMEVEANLWDSLGNIIIGDKVEIQASSLGDSIVYMESQYASLRVKVQWGDAYLQFYKKPSVKAPEMQKRRKTVHGRELQSTSLVTFVDGFASLCVSGLSYWADRQVEVFSIHIGGITKDISAVCGTVFIDDGSLSKLHIYNKDESSVEYLTEDNVLLIEGPSRPISNLEFGIGLNLKDPVQDLEVSRGSVCWHAGNLEMHMSWLNKRLCSVIRGKDGFAAVHYIIFGNAFAASIEARIISNSTDDGIPVNVCGHIWTQYSGFNYSRKYHKKYYRSRLLNLSQSKSVALKTGSNIPLCRSIVSVPVKSHLLIEADLRICRSSADGYLEEEAVFGIEEFENNMATTRKDIKGVDYKIELSVKFFSEKV